MRVLVEAIQSGDLDRLRRCLASVPIPSADDEVRFAMKVAIQKDLPEVVEVFLDVRRDVLAEGGDGTPVLWAAAAGRLQLVKRLLMLPDVAIDGEDSDGMTPLLHAAYNQDLEMVRLLVDAGADINHRNFEGRTALDLARVRRFSVESVPLIGPGHGNRFRLRETDVSRYLAGIADRELAKRNRS